MNDIARWNGSQWETNGSYWEPDGYGIEAMEMYKGKLYAVVYGEIMAWDGSAWSRAGTPDSGPHHRILTMTVFENNLYAAGIDDPPWGGGGPRPVWKWDGSEWTSSSQTFSRVTSLQGNGAKLYAGVGEEVSWGNNPDYSWLVELNGSEWSVIGSGYNHGSVYGIGNFEGSLVVGGDFDYLYVRDGEWVVNNVHRQGLFVSNNTLYFHRKEYHTYADDIDAWNGSAWSDTSPPQDRITAIGGDSQNLYSAQRGTQRTYPQSSTAPKATQIYRLDGSEWTPVGSTAIGEVHAITVWEGNLYIGGTFTSMYAGVSANRIAMWDGNDWVPLESGMDGPVYTLVGSDKGLLVGGEFASAGGLDANHVALWDGNAWAAVGTGTDGPVFTLATAGDWLFAGGFFSSAGDSEANNIAVWDGERWSGLGSGTSGPVFALAPSGNRLYVGGKFFTVGGKPAGIFAMATFRQPSPPQLRLVRQPDSDEIILHVEGPPDSSIQIEATSDLSGSWTPIGTATEVSPGVYEFSDPAATDLPRRFYRVVD